MEKFFKLGLRGTDKKTEIIAGLTTFMTMAYVLAVQPAAICGGEAYITDVNGVVITKSAIMITCALVSGLITLLMAFYTNFPFALSTGMGSNFILGALIQSQALSFGAAMAITLISGIIFVLLTVFGLRDLIVRVIPKNIKIAISASIGFFIAYLGFKNCGIGSFENGIALGNLTDPAVLLAIGGLLLIIVLNALNVKGAILISIIATTLIGIPLGVTTLNGKALISVRNEGDTIPAEEIPLLFERFHKSDKSRSEDKDGVGLGLYVVKTILDQHKEHIAVTSENGLTTFTFSVTLAGGQTAQ